MIEPLLAWYAAHLDGDWEHDNGFTIETTDNPGILITLRPSFDLGPERVVEPDEIQNDVYVWGIRVRANALVGFCGPGREAALIARLLEIEAGLAAA
ncbi:Imm53 family immunity protein [Gymnodinialimonas sp.]